MIRVFHPGSRIRILTFYPSRIPDPDPQNCGKNEDFSHQLESGDFGNVVVPPLPLLLLQLDGDAADGGALQPLHQMSDEPGNLRSR
jgi:hypothetical protein